MRFWCVLLLSLLGVLPAQVRHAAVELDDGQVLSGVVQHMDLASLQLQVGDVLHTLPATRIRSCRFESIDKQPAVAPVPQQPAPPPVRAVVRPPVPTAVPPVVEDPVATEHVPTDLRGHTLWRRRVERADELYPWLVPAVPTQWLSLGLLALALSSLVVQLSTRVAGAEAASFQRSVGVAVWYLITAALQVAMVPVSHFSIVLMLLSNTAMALFWLRSLFGLTRAGAVIAFAVQLGFALVGYGVLELVTAVLASVGVTS